MAQLDNTGRGLGDGRTEVAVAGTRVQLSTASVEARSIVITAETNNTGVITVGGSTVVGAEATRRGTPLTAGQSMTVDIGNLNGIWLDTTVNTDGVTYTYLT